MTYQCGVCNHWVRQGETHCCTGPRPNPPLLVLPSVPVPSIELPRRAA